MVVETGLAQNSVGFGVEMLIEGLGFTTIL